MLHHCVLNIVSGVLKGDLLKRVVKSGFSVIE